MITVVGAGMVGLTQAALLAQRGLDVTVIDSKTPALTWDNDSLDARVVALNPPAINTLNNIGVWQHINPTSLSPFKSMHVWDNVTGESIDFDAATTRHNALGYIVENRAIIKALWQHCQQQTNLTLLTPHTISDITQCNTGVRLTLDSPQTITTDLCIAADGASSFVRQQLDASLIERPYHHSAIVCVIHCEKPHHHVARQVFLKDGPLALLPLHNPQHCAIVWSRPPATVHKTLDLDTNAFNLALTNAFSLKLGLLTQCSKPISIPLTMRHLKNYVHKRIIFIGDSAHTIHPLAGLGANLGIADAVSLAQHIDTPNQWQRFERERIHANETTLLLMRFLKDLFCDQSTLTRLIRQQGLHWVSQFFNTQLLKWAQQ